MSDTLLTAWCVGAIATLSVSAIAAELWRSRERWREGAENALKMRAHLHAENTSLREELARRTK